MNEKHHRPRSTSTATKRTLLNREIKAYTVCQTNKDRLEKEEREPTQVSPGNKSAVNISLAHHRPTKVPRDTHESRQQDANPEDQHRHSQKRHVPAHLRIPRKTPKSPCADPSLLSPEGRLHLLVLLYPVLPPLYSFLYSALMSLRFLPFMYFAWHNSLCFSV